MKSGLFGSSPILIEPSLITTDPSTSASLAITLPAFVTSKFGSSSLPPILIEPSLITTDPSISASFAISLPSLVT